MTVATPAPSGSATSTTPPPRTWTFTNRYTGEPTSFTCMDGCTIDHSRDFGTPTFPEDVFCWSAVERVTLPVNENGKPEEYNVLGTILKVEPFSSKIAERLPYATVELVDDHFVENLDPDGFETVINTLAERLEAMRATHRRLVETRNAYMTRQVRAA